MRTKMTEKSLERLSRKELLDLFDKVPYHPVVDNLWEYYKEHGLLTEKQENLLLKISHDLVNDPKPAPLGRNWVQGKVLKIQRKVLKSGYECLKWAVRDERAFVVWGSVPKGALQGSDPGEPYLPKKGDTVLFSADILEYPGNSRFFRFYQRPTKGVVVEKA